MMGMKLEVVAAVETNAVETVKLRGDGDVVGDLEVAETT
jgi:hypothetical protein